jgi:hypothetical protein
MKPPEQCTCSVHLMTDYSKYSRNPKLLRRARRDSLDNARRWRAQIETEPDPKQKVFLELSSVCAEWSAWICLNILRDLRKAERQ